MKTNIAISSDSVIHFSTNRAQKYQRVRANLMLGVTLQYTNIPSGVGEEVFATDTWKFENARQISFPKSFARALSRFKHVFHE